MKTYEISEIIKMWEHVEITVDQAIGQLLLHVQQLSQKLATVERLLDSQPLPPNPQKNE